MCDLRANVRSRYHLLRPLIGREHHVDGNIAIRMAVRLNPRTLHSLHPGIEIILRLNDVASVWRIRTFIGLAHGHGAFGEGPVSRVLRSGAETNPLVAEAGADSILNHCL